MVRILKSCMTDDNNEYVTTLHVGILGHKFSRDIIVSINVKTELEAIVTRGGHDRPSTLIRKKKAKGNGANNN